MAHGPVARHGAHEEPAAALAGGGGDGADGRPPAAREVRDPRAPAPADLVSAPRRRRPAVARQAEAFDPLAALPPAQGRSRDLPGAERTLARASVATWTSERGVGSSGASTPPAATAKYQPVDSLGYETLRHCAGSSVSALPRLTPKLATEDCRLGKGSGSPCGSVRKRLTSATRSEPRNGLKHLCPSGCLSCLSPPSWSLPLATRGTPNRAPETPPGQTKDSDIRTRDTPGVTCLRKHPSHGPNTNPGVLGAGTRLPVISYLFLRTGPSGPRTQNERNGNSKDISVGTHPSPLST